MIQYPIAILITLLLTVFLALKYVKNDGFLCLIVFPSIFLGVMSLLWIPFMFLQSYAFTSEHEDIAIEYSKHRDCEYVYVYKDAPTIKISDRSNGVEFPTGYYPNFLEYHEKIKKDKNNKKIKQVLLGE